MTAPTDGVERLIYFVDARIAQLKLTKEEVARRGGPSVDTLAKIRGRRDQHTPLVGTLLRLDSALGWQPGSAAVVLLGGQPLSLIARGGGAYKTTAGHPMTEREIMARLVSQLREEITRLEGDREAVDARIHGLRTIHDRFLAELSTDNDVVADYGRSQTSPVPAG
ncbi:helix-turn-helix domain-containing protein [Mycobacterium intracellulare]|uniref:helix-turn-helix domain-containing protein n=1 Tax=Mycobacterium intracellulare TaxID=1767 RepID=UPI0009EC4FA3|nr:hypothetical protein [Mycobacterium intracellulare]